MSKRFGLVIKTSQRKKNLRSHGFTSEFCQIFKEELMLILLKFFQKNRKGGNSYISTFYEASLKMIPRPFKDSTRKRKLQTNMADEHKFKNHQQNISK